MSFEWQTEDERSWEQPDATAGSREPRRWRRWPWLILLIGLIGAGAYLGWQQVQERVEQGAETVREEVRASHRLAQRAAADRDQELFVSLLSGRSATWTDVQRTRLERGLLFGETGRLLAFDATSAADVEPQVELNPDLTEAVLTVGQPFVVDAGSGLTETVVLTQTHVYRRGSQRWLLSPPDDAFWGSWQTRDGQTLHLAYAQRDEELALRLHEDLERKLMEMCRTLADCPEDFHMRLRLETDVQSVLQAGSGGERLDGRRELTLPTPTLVGVPGDEAAYAALFRGYARHVVSTALIDVLGYTCCEVALFQTALLDWQLSRLSLRSAPLAPQDYLYLVDAPLSVEQLIQLSRPQEALAPDEEAPLEVHAFVDFLRGRLAMRRDPLMDMQRSLSQSGSFWSWVSFLTEYDAADPTRLQADWSAFVWQKAREAQTLAQPLTPELQPQQDIVAVCGDQTMDVYRYSLPDGQWTKEVSAGVEYAALAALPGGTGYMMTGQLPEQNFETGLVTYMRRGAEEPFAIAGSRSTSGAVLPLYEPGGERMVVWLFNQQNGAGSVPANGLLDPETCTPEGCEVRSIPGLPIWSPEGRLALVVDVSSGNLLYLPQDATRWESLERESAIWPFWIDERSFAFVEAGSISNRNTLYAVDVASGETTQLLTSSELSGAVEPVQRGSTFRIGFAARHPLHENTLLVGATANANATQSYLFTLSINDAGSSLTEVTSQVRVLDSFEGDLDQGWFDPSHIQGSRFLVLPLTLNGSVRLPSIIFYDLREEHVALTTTMGQASGFLVGAGQWSADQRWFAHTLDRAIDIVAPSVYVDGRPLRQLVFHDFARCESATWVNKEQ